MKRSIYTLVLFLCSITSAFSTGCNLVEIRHNVIVDVANAEVRATKVILDWDQGGTSNCGEHYKAETRQGYSIDGVSKDIYYSNGGYTSKLDNRFTPDGYNYYRPSDFPNDCDYSSNPINASYYRVSGISNTDFEAVYENSAPHTIERTTFRIPKDLLLTGKRIRYYVSSQPGRHTCSFSSVTSFYDVETYMYTDLPRNLRQDRSSSGCGGIKIEWDEPESWSNFPGLRDHAFFAIYKNGSYVAPLSSDQNSFSDINAKSGETHTYSIGIEWRFSNRLFLTPASPSISCQSLFKPPVPGPLTINQTCGDNEFTVSYDAVPTASHYRLVYVDDANGAITTTGLTTNLSITDNKPFGKSYQVLVEPFNTCGVQFGGALHDLNIFSETTAPAGLTVNAQSNGKLLVDWNDVIGEQEYRLRKTDASGSSTDVFIRYNESQYEDGEVELCQDYTYEVFAFSECNSGASNEAKYLSTGARVTGRINAFDSTQILDQNSFSASKGYFSDRVELDWGLLVGEGNLIEYEVYRRELGDQGDYQLLTTIDNPKVRRYVDQFTEAGTFYEYKIKAFGQCGSLIFGSNEIVEVGFRRAVGIINGKVSYIGGIPVPNVQLNVEKAIQGSGSSYKFDGSGNMFRLKTAVDGLNFNNDQKIDSVTDYTFEAWLKFDESPAQNSRIITSFDATNSFGADRLTQLSINSNSFYFEIYKNGSVEIITKVATSSIYNTSWNHVAGVAKYLEDEDQTVLSLLLNGARISSDTISGKTYADLSRLSIGNQLNAYVDEVRVWSEAKSEADIRSYYKVKTNGNESNLIGAWDFDERFGEGLYDKARIGDDFNENHLYHTSGNASGWSSEAPNSAQLSNAAFTDSFGAYTITVPFSGSGENFTVVPNYLTHNFDPVRTVLFLGDGAFIHNNIDFLDQSAFTFKGELLFEESQCPVADAFVAIDGNIVTNIENQPIKTDADGLFEINVPIGEHVVTVSKPNHEFSAGRFPTTGTFDFQDDIDDRRLFVNSTKVKVIGRAVGGLRELNKFPGVGRSKNNIGVARIIFSSFDGCFADTVLTNAVTGEYSIELLPLNYLVTAELINNNENITLSNNNSSLDLSQTPPATTIADTQLVENGEPIIESVTYHQRLDFGYRSQPELEVIGPWVDEDNPSISKVFGDTVLSYQQFGIKDKDTTVNLIDNPLDWDVFTENHETNDFRYKVFIKAFEQYTNYDIIDTIIRDSVPVTDGLLRIDNNLATVVETGVEMKNVNSNIDTLQSLMYSFIPGKPNFNVVSGTTDPDLIRQSLTQTMDIYLERPNGTIIPWVYERPDIGYSGVYRAYMIGGNPLPGDFFTEGPKTVDFVLRDPPGDASFATKSVGTSFVHNESFGWSLTNDNVSKDKFWVGLRLNLGFAGVETVTDIEDEFSVGFSSQLSGGRSGSIERVVTNTQSWSTNPDAANVGTGSDLFYGHSKNVEFGIVEYMRIVPTAIASTAGDVLINFGNGFSGVKTSSFSVKSTGYNTGFVFTQDFIENIEIPRLIELRNGILKEDPRYVVDSRHPLPEDPRYGTNNSDPVWGAEATNGFSGPSYEYIPNNREDSIKDLVRDFNQQIRLWEGAILKNEEEKIRIDSSLYVERIKDAQIQEINFRYLRSNLAYFALEATGGITATLTNLAAAGLGTIVKAPGFASVQAVGFAISTPLQISAVELLRERTKYLDEIAEVERRFSNLGKRNHTISGGVETTFEISTERVISSEETIEYSQSVELLSQTEGKISNTGIGVYRGISLAFNRSGTRTDANGDNNVISYTLADGDNADFYSVDVYPSMQGWGPIFKRRPGGKTSCPYEPEETTKYYQPGTVLQAATLQRDLPELNIPQKVVSNVPVDQAAVFNLELSNLTQTGDDMPYTVKVLTSSNPHGAIVRINGSATQTPQVAAGTTSRLTLTVEKGPGAQYDYDSLLVVAHSVCQYDFGISPIYKDIADSVYISARFIPTCTDVEILEPANNFVLNNDFNNELAFFAGGYDVNYFDFESLELQYKPTAAADWRPIETFYMDTTGLVDALPIPDNKTFTDLLYNVNHLPDGEYDLRAITHCSLADKISETVTIKMDRVDPHPFGKPSPQDGILAAEDDISIRFNEDLDEGAINRFNFDVRAVLNGTPFTQSANLYFDGNDDVTISAGANIQKRDFTIEFWAKRDAINTQEVVFSQGSAPQENLSIGFTSSNQIAFNIGNQQVFSDSLVTDNSYHHYAFIYNHELEIVVMLLDGSIANPNSTSILGDFVAEETLYLGRSATTSQQHFTGNLFDVRVWGIARTPNQINASRNAVLSRVDAGLLYNWKLNEAEGLVVTDAIRQRNGVINGATWRVRFNGNAIALNGTSDTMQIQNTGATVITNDMDLTIEFWFNSGQTGAATLFSNGSGNDSLADGAFSVNIEKTASGQLIFKHSDIELPIGNQNYFDGNWHHLAVVVERGANISAYIDGALQSTLPASEFKQFGAPNISVGHRGYVKGVVPQFDQFYTGIIDEIRIWNAARTVEQLTRDKLNRLNGDELGLVAYVPFELYEEELGTITLTPNLTDQVNENHNVVVLNGETFSTNTPNIKIQRPITKLDVTFSTNGDEIVIEPSISLDRIENTILDISVTGVPDLSGNKTQGTKTWTAFVDQNQVVWQDNLKSVQTETEQAVTFTTAVVNNGGEPKAYTISNLPLWLTASQNSGTIAPNSIEQITFTIDEFLAIGSYTEDIHLTTDFGFPEVLTVQVEVTGEVPNWTVNPAEFENSMSIVGYLSVNEVISTDDRDMVAAFIGNTLHGVANLQYVEALDRYLLFMDVHTNVLDDSLTFRAYDASTGITHTDVIPQVRFQANSIVGNVGNPQLFEAGFGILQTIPVQQGWNWVSFNLSNPDSTNINAMMRSINAQVGDELKGPNSFARYESNGNWLGTLTANGVNPTVGYRLFVANDGNLEVYGEVIDPTTRNITLSEGWNRIGFISIRNQSINSALSNLNATSGDVIKGQASFAIYDDAIGWIGSLKTMVPNESYMYQAQDSTTFTYPLAGGFKSKLLNNNEIDNQIWSVNEAQYANNMNQIVQLTNCNNTAVDFEALDQWYIGAFDDLENCRGVVDFNEVLNETMAFLTISGDHKERLNYALVDKHSSTKLALNFNREFESNAIEGSIADPVLISIPEKACKQLSGEMVVNGLVEVFKVYPTIFENKINMLYTSQTDESVTVRLYKIDGSEILNQRFDVKEGNNTIKWDLTEQLHLLSSGAYLLEFTNSADEVHRSKLIHF